MNKKTIWTWIMVLVVLLGAFLAKNYFAIEYISEAGMLTYSDKNDWFGNRWNVAYSTEPRWALGFTTDEHGDLAIVAADQTGEGEIRLTSTKNFFGNDVLIKTDCPSPRPLHCSMEVNGVPINEYSDMFLYIVDGSGKQLTYVKMRAPTDNVLIKTSVLDFNKISIYRNGQLVAPDVAVPDDWRISFYESNYGICNARGCSVGRISGIDFVKYRMVFGCKAYYGEVLGMETFNAGSQVDLFSFRNTVERFCTEHGVTITDAESQGSTESLEPIEQIITEENGQPKKLTVPAGQKWTFFYVFKGTGEKCSANTFYDTSSGKCAVLGSGAQTIISAHNESQTTKGSPNKEISQDSSTPRYLGLILLIIAIIAGFILWKKRK